MRKNTYIAYENDAVQIEYSAESNRCKFSWKASERWKYRRVKISYIPSERNLVAAIPNWYQVSMNKDNILDFMQEWEFARKAFPNGQQILDLPASYEYNTTSQTDRVRLENGKELDLTMTSSGLQALTPLYVTLRYITKGFFQDKHVTVEQSILRENLLKTLMEECSMLTDDDQQRIANQILTHHHTDMFIEEPEAHIFPTTQKSFVYALVGMLNGDIKHNCFIATHSPYILTAFNNVILAGEKLEASEDNEKKTSAVLGRKQTLKFSEVAAFEVKDGMVKPIMDEEFQLISADAIDSASQEIGADFDYLLNI